MTALLRVLAVDDEAPALDELTYLLGRHPDIGEVVAVGDATAAPVSLVELLANEPAETEGFYAPYLYWEGEGGAAKGAGVRR